MTDPTTAHDHQASLARRLHANNSWITAGYFDSAEPDETVARNTMLADGRLNARIWDGIAIVELTDAGRAWIANAEETR